MVKYISRKQQAERNKELKANGYRKIDMYPHLFINESGKVFNVNLNKFECMKKDRNCLSTHCNLSVPKLLLYVFANEPYRERTWIRYKDGNRKNISIDNLEYVSCIDGKPTPPVNDEGLYTAIRCYFPVLKRYKTGTLFLTKRYLYDVAKSRLFFEQYRQSKHIEVFRSYLTIEFTDRAKIAKMHGIIVRDCNHIINTFINMLIDDVLRDLDKGILQIQDYLKPGRKRSARDSIKSFRKTVEEIQKTVSSDT